MISPNKRDPQNSTPNNSNQATTITDDKQLDILVSQLAKENLENSIPSLLEMVNSSEKARQFYGAKCLRKLLAIKKDPSIQGLIDAGGVPPLAQLMQFSTEPKIQHEAAQAVTNLCSGTPEQTLQVLSSGALQSFLALLDSPNEEIVEQGLWDLGNLRVDSTEIRDLVLQYDAVGSLVNVLESNPSLSMKQQGMWILSSLCREEPAPPYELTSKAVPVICDCIKLEEEQLLTDAV